MLQVCFSAFLLACQALAINPSTGLHEDLLCSFLTCEIHICEIKFHICEFHIWNAHFHNVKFTSARTSENTHRCLRRMYVFACMSACMYTHQCIYAHLMCDHDLLCQCRSRKSGASSQRSASSRKSAEEGGAEGGGGGPILVSFHMRITLCFYFY